MTKDVDAVRRRVKTAEMTARSIYAHIISSRADRRNTKTYGNDGIDYILDGFLLQRNPSHGSKVFAPCAPFHAGLLGRHRHEGGDARRKHVVVLNRTAEPLRLPQAACAVTLLDIEQPLLAADDHESYNGGEEADQRDGDPSNTPVDLLADVTAF